ncbi:MAG: IS5 family transposase [Bacteroidetes bacterium]|nr:IS5 family transposase [Bacteroidota bacterium]
MFWKQIQDLPDKRFKRLTGVSKAVFQEMRQSVMAHQQKHRKHPTRGKPPKLGLEDKLLVMLMYYREYRTYEHIGMSESRVCEIVQAMERILIADKRFHLPGKRQLLQSDSEIEVVLIDVSETPIERPKKKQRQYYSGKKKKHTLKTQVIAEKKTRKIIATAFSKGRRHDLNLFKQSRTTIHPAIKTQTDTGYQGIQKLHNNAELPKKRSKKNPLAKTDKKQNQQISSSRVAIENIIRELKIFRILAEKYRNRRRRFSLRFNLIAAFLNLSIK